MTTRYDVGEALTLDYRGLSLIQQGIYHFLSCLYASSGRPIDETVIETFVRSHPAEQNLSEEVAEVLDRCFVYDEETHAWYRPDIDAQLEHDQETTAAAAASAAAPAAGPTRSGKAKRSVSPELSEKRRAAALARWNKARQTEATSSAEKSAASAQTAPTSTRASERSSLVKAEAKSAPQSAQQNDAKSAKQNEANLQKQKTANLHETPAVRGEVASATRANVHESVHPLASSRASESDSDSDLIFKKSESESEIRSVISKETTVARAREATASFASSSTAVHAPQANAADHAALCQAARTLIEAGFNAKLITEANDKLAELDNRGLTDDMLKAVVERMKTAKPQDYAISVKYLLQCLSNELAKAKSRPERVRHTYGLNPVHHYTPEEAQRAQEHNMRLAISLGFDPSKPIPPYKPPIWQRDDYDGGDECE